MGEIWYIIMIFITVIGGMLETVVYGFSIFFIPVFISISVKIIIVDLVVISTF